jgi:hypothetical protein
MTPLEFKELYSREFDNLRNEISAYTNENNLWLIAGDIKNSPGNLCLHLLGNVNHFIGATLGKTGYVRKRDEEFSGKNISKEKLLEDIATTRATMEMVLSETNPLEMKKDFPVELFGRNSTEYMLAYFLGHFMYHVGQINYHRRLI